jgi:hypothetical protein
MRLAALSSKITKSAFSCSASKIASCSPGSSFSGLTFLEDLTDFFGRFNGLYL